MKNKQVHLLYSISVIQVLGIGIAVSGGKAGVALSAVGTLILTGYVTSIWLKAGKKRICPECRSAIPKNGRICPECGYRYHEGIPEEKLTAYIEHEKEEEMTSEKIDRDFEKIESIVVDEMSAYDGDIEAFLRGRGKEEEI